MVICGFYAAYCDFFLLINRRKSYIIDMMMIKGVKRMMRRGVAIALLLALCLLGGCRGAEPKGDTRVLLDGKPWDGAKPGGSDDLRVYVTLDGADLIDLPFDEAHTLEIIQPDGARNTVSLTGEAVTMISANCENQDCVHMGEVTRDNLELRVMGGFIICLPHKVSVEVRGG